METKQTIKRLEFVSKWNEHLNEFERLLSSFKGDYSDFQKFKSRLNQAKYHMQELITEVSKNIEVE